MGHGWSPSSVVNMPPCQIPEKPPTAKNAICACAALWPGPAESATLTDETACLQVLEAASRFLSGYLIGKLSDTTGLFVRAVIVQLVRTCNTSTPEKVHLSACDKGAARAQFLTAIARVGTLDPKWRSMIFSANFLAIELVHKSATALGLHPEWLEPATL